LFRLRDHVPWNCTACPHDYVSSPTTDRPRRCTLSRRTASTAQVQESPLQTEEYDIFTADNPNDNATVVDHCNDGAGTNDEEENEIVFEMDGVHCGEDSGLGSVWEANLRMPAMIQWSGTIAPNTSTDALVSSLDITPTILSLIFGTDNDNTDDSIVSSTVTANHQYDDVIFDGQDVSSVWLRREGEYDSDGRVLFFWRDGFLLNLQPLGPPYGRFDVVAVKVGRIKLWYYT
jgi:arylsulfatase A-like enzyme